jgi:hypothetical protein
MNIKNIKIDFNKKIIIKYLKLFVKTIVIYFVFMIIFSIVFPKHLFFMDNARLYIQSRLLIFAGTYNSQSYDKIIENELTYV